MTDDALVSTPMTDLLRKADVIALWEKWQQGFNVVDRAHSHWSFMEFAKGLDALPTVPAPAWQPPTLVRHEANGHTHVKGAPCAQCDGVHAEKCDGEASESD